LINSTLKVINGRVGINTEEPEMALGIWDEEVSIIAGKIKENTGYIGTSRSQNLCLGTNRVPMLEIDLTGLVTLKKLRINQHRLAFESELPNYSGTKGDFVINSNPSVSNDVVGWQCLGGHKWKVIKSIE
jgi:hypothetical protein